MKNFFHKHSINIAIVTVLVLILISASFSYYNDKVMQKAISTKEQADMIIRQVENTFLVIRNMDISSRGFALIPEDRFLFYSVETAREQNRQNFQTLDSLLAVQGYSDPQNYEAMKKGFNNYVDMYAQMVKHLRNNDHEAYLTLLAQDYGKEFWTVNEAFSEKLFAFQARQNAEADKAYETAVLRNRLVQLLLVLMGLPTLGFALRMKAEASNTEKLLLNVQENNRKYLFNVGGSESRDASEILGSSNENLQKAAHFVNEITEGNYEAQWDQLNESNAALNQTNLVGRLIVMREKMKAIKHEDEKRLWANEGLSQFSILIRNHQQDIQSLAYEAVVFIVKYLHAQQGALFVVNQEEQNNKFIELKACYAFNRKKHLTKKIEIGEGLIGQAYLEAETTFMTDIPEGYTTITSGLGDATPKSLLIIPMKYNDEVQAILEIASFTVYEPYQIEFLEKIGEFVASAVTTAQTNEITKRLLLDAQRMAEEMRAQEEEMRQNMEELSATQEEMIRKEKEYLSRIEQLEAVR